MSQRRWLTLGLILLLLGLAIWINLPNSQITLGQFSRDLSTRLGLDLQGGLQVLLEADLPETTPIDAEQLDVARQILENRSNALGVEEVNFQTAGSRRLVGEYPGAENAEEVLQTIRVTGLLEFVDMGDTRLEEGTVIDTDFGTSGDSVAPTPVPTQEATIESTAVAPETVPQIWHTVMTGGVINEVSVSTDQLGQYQVNFTLSPEGAQIFAEYTTANVGKILGIVLDKTVISAPSISTAIPDGSGYIEGNFDRESANALAIQLRYGSLPIPLKVVETREIGPTLGEDSLQKSLIAGFVGLTIIALFMTLYYRLPGAVAVLAILFYGLITLALFKLIPVTLTLPGIAGLMLSTGSALDANILIFERLKEELRSGKTLAQALPLSWKRAWPSIRDSNIATLITCAILFWFGSSFGATIVKGFAVTLALGVAVSLFTALIVTRTFLTTLLETVRPTNLPRWFGI